MAGSRFPEFADRSCGCLKNLRLVTLELTNNTIVKDTISNLFGHQYPTTLVNLKIRYAYLDQADGTHDVVQLIKASANKLNVLMLNNNNLTMLEEGLAEALSECIRLQLLCLSHNVINDDGVFQLASLLGGLVRFFSVAGYTTQWSDAGGVCVCAE